MTPENLHIFVLSIVSVIFFNLQKIKDNKDFLILNNIFLKPYNKWITLNSKTEIKGFPNIELNFPNHNILKKHWEQIRDESINVYNLGDVKIFRNDIFFDLEIIGADNKWKRFIIKWYGDINTEAFKICPITTKLIQQIPEIKLAAFAVLEPGGHIPYHLGIFKGCLRYHLGLDCPEDSFIWLNCVKYNWKNGEDILFDDTYLHYVKNNSDKKRIILFCDVERTMKDEFSKKINNFIMDYLGPSTSKFNDK
jgi:beta-hydroxylase